MLFKHFLERIAGILLSSTALLTIGCGGAAERDDGRISAVVSILPQQYFLQRIAGSFVDIFVIVPPGASPATYEPTSSDMRFISGADVWFTVGVGFEDAWIPRFRDSADHLRIISTISGITRVPMDRYSLFSSGEVEGDAGGTENGHAHGSIDPHVWLSPGLVKEQAMVMEETLAGLDSSRADYYSVNLQEFCGEIDSLEALIHSILDPLPNRSFMVFHPAWGYFADEFDLDMIPVESGGSQPAPGEMSALIDLARERGISTVFVSPQFSQQSARALANEIGGRVESIDPLAESWSENLVSVAGAIAESLRQ